MPLSPRTLRPSSNWTPKSISGLALWLDASDSQSLWTTDAGAVTAVSSPTEIAGCVLWLDGADSSAASMTLNGSLVETWKDKSNSGNNVTASGGLRPTLTGNALNGRSVLTFGGSQGLTGNLAASITTNAYSVFVVCRISGAITNGRLLSTAGVGNDFASGSVIPCVSNGGTLSAYAGTQGTTPSSVTGFASYGVFAGVLSSNLVTNSAGGMSVASAAATLSTAVTRLGVGVAAQGGTGFNTCDIAEIILYPTALSNADRARVEAYLAQRWGISGVHTQATATSDPVGAWLDKSGNARHATQSTAGSRPTISATAQNGRKALAFDGANGWMRTERTTYAARSVFTVFRRTGTAPLYSSPFGKQSNVAAGYGGSSYQVAYGNEGGWSVTDSSTQKLWYTSNGSPHKLSAVYMRGAAMPLAAAQSYQTGIAAAPNTTDAELLYAEAATDTDGNQAWFLGTEPFATTRKYPANILEVLIYNRAVTATERLRIERYLAARWGITLAPTVSNADAQNWIDRVYANGGTVSSSTAAAVSTFCDAIDAASIRDRFYRLNLFAGGTSGTTAGLAACLVPLYRGPSLGGTQYGNTTDTNVGPFVVGDYAETGASGGLLGNGTSKYLNTGLTVSDIGTAASGHMSVYHGQSSGANVNRYCMGANDASTANRFYLGTDAFVSASVVAQYGATQSANQTLASQGHGTAGHRILSRETDSLLTHYHNGSVVGTNTTGITPAVSTAAFAVFAVNRNGTVDRWHNSWIAAYSIGLGLNSTQAANYRTIMQAFQTALGRNV